MFICLAIVEEEDKKEDKEVDKEVTEDEKQKEENEKEGICVKIENIPPIDIKEFQLRCRYLFHYPR